MSEMWVPAPPKGAHDGHAVIVCSCEGGAYIGARKAGTVDRCEACGFITPAQLAAIQAATLREYAAELDWKRPEKCPCENPESCCGSESSCDAMQPIANVVGAASLRARADAIVTAAQPTPTPRETGEGQ